jgi:glycosyl transferase family 25
MQRQMDALNLSFEFIKAVDGRLMSDKEITQVTSIPNYAFLPGEIGCALSHQLIYKKMTHENIDTALILEDDVVLSEDICAILKNLNLSNYRPEVILLSRVNKHLQKSIRPITKEYSLHKTHQATTAHSYLINKSAAESLLNNLYPVWMTADKWTLFEELSFLRVYSVIPHPVALSDESNDSTINMNKGNSDFNKKKRKIWQQLMSKRPIKAKIKHRYRRAIVPLFNKIVDQGKG